VGKPYHTGQHSILGYQWELETIKKMGVTKDFPVFITETGWPHREGVNQKNNFFTTKTTSQFLLDAYQVWSTDKRVQAVTPFIFNYPHQPFDHFSWLDQNEQLYPEYQKIIDAAKSTNSPAQITQYQLYRNQIPFLIFANHEYSGQISLKNTGQSIWGEAQFCIDPKVESNIEISSLCVNQNDNIKPGQIKIFNYTFTIKDTNSPKINIYWDNLPETEINLISENSNIYHPRFNIINRLKSFLTKFW
jgi:hypothetical protein